MKTQIEVGDIVRYADGRWYGQKEPCLIRVTFQGFGMTYGEQCLGRELAINGYVKPATPDDLIEWQKHNPKPYNGELSTRFPQLKLHTIVRYGRRYEHEIMRLTGKFGLNFVGTSCVTKVMNIALIRKCHSATDEDLKIWKHHNP